MASNGDLETRRTIEYSSNAYEIVSQIARDARKLDADTNHRILQSRAITHVINNTKPDLYDVNRQRDEYEARTIRDMFCYIDDVDVKHAVYDSFYDSKHGGELMFVYNDIEDSGRRARVRVLTRMLYHTLICNEVKRK